MWAARSLERRPAVRDAAARGHVSIGQAKPIGEALDALPTSLDRASRAAAEQLMLREAQHAPAEKLRTMTERVLQLVAPEKSDLPDQRAAKLAERDVRARSRRRLWFGPEHDGSIEFGGSLPASTGEGSRSSCHHARSILAALRSAGPAMQRPCSTMTSRAVPDDPVSAGSSCHRTVSALGGALQRTQQASFVRRSADHDGPPSRR